MSAQRFTKAQIIDAIVAVKPELQEMELKKLTVKKLRALAEEHSIALEPQEAPEESQNEGDGAIPLGVISDAKADRLMAEGVEKFAYVQEKDPTPKHEFYAAMITALTGIEVTPKQYQAMILTHRYIQASDLNRARKDYRPRTAASVLQAAETLARRADEMLVDDHGAVISKSATRIPEEVAQKVLSRITPEPEDVEEVEEAEELQEA